MSLVDALIKMYSVRVQVGDFRAHGFRRVPHKMGANLYNVTLARNSTYWGHDSGNSLYSFNREVVNT